MNGVNLKGQPHPYIPRLLILGIALMLASTATEVAADGEAGQADEFLRYGADVRSLGMGRAYVALADEASALYYNPAGLLRLKRGLSLYGMHFKPLYESNYNFFSFAVSRPNPNATGLRGFFFGPRSAWGLSFVRLGSGGYEQRDDDDNLDDENFELYQWALMLGFAREEAGTAGILSYGTTFKVVRQGVSGATSEYGGSEGSFGLDIGAQLQMINPPLLKELTRVPLIGTFFQLKHLMPLHLGLSIRNVISPELGYGGESDKYPTALRLGASYRLPSDWLLQNSRIFLVSDFEWLYDDMDRLIHFDRRVEVHDVAPGAGQYFGTEFQYRTAKLQLSPRFGLSHVYDDWKVSAGLGLAFKTSGLDFQFDFAHGFHEELADDQRISLTIRFGDRRDARYYYDGKQTQTNLSPKVNLLHVLSEYPDNRSLVRLARDSLAGTLDTLNRMRYLEMFIDLSLGDYWYLRARQELEKGNFDLANIYTNKAIAAYKEVRKDTTIVFSDNDLLNNAESYAIAAITESDEKDARRHWQRAGELADSIGGDTLSTGGDTLRAAYLQGLGAKATGSLSGAMEHFETALSTTSMDSRSMRLLSRYELSKCLMESGQADSSLKVLKTFFDNPNSTADSLADHYPRFPAYPDRRLSDDALFMTAEYYGSKGLSLAEGAPFRERYLREGLLSFGNICRFYPDLDKCRDSDIESHISELIDQLSE
ncbi:MAG: hypothetical protein KAV00_14885 [Phycisphaerae bacterium]|nr:hypothetical protein [Phycisphaerae bacterium]